MPKIFIIAGEESGDLLGAAILRAFRHPGEGRGPETARGPGLRRDDVVVHGIGGAAMSAAGMAPSIIPMKNLSVMGVFEILPRVPYFIRAINQTVRAIENFAPDIIITIDSPDFCFRVLQKLKARGVCRAPRVHVVAPTVWAWRPGRARKVAAFSDGLICLFPFEPPYFTRHGLRAISMGHPMIESDLGTANPAPLRTALSIAPDEITIGLYPGSRGGTLRRHLPIFIKAVNDIAARHSIALSTNNRTRSSDLIRGPIATKMDPRDKPEGLEYPINYNIRVLIPTFDHLADQVRGMCAAHAKFRYDIITNSQEKIPAMRACDAALSVTGTVALELSVADVPHVTAYRLPWLTWFFVRLMVRTPFAHLANIILGRRVIPEMIQGACAPGPLAAALDPLIQNPQDRQAQRAAFADVRVAIGQETHPAETAAAFIQEFL